MTLREAIDAVMIEKDWDQTELGTHIGAPQSMVSRMRKGDDWELHWQVFLRLLRLLVTLKIISRAELSTMRDDVAETFDGIRRRIVRIESALMTLKDSGSHFLLPLQLPERWRKS